MMTLEAAWSRGLALQPISAAQVAASGLSGVRLLVVPGGWSARKKKALGLPGAAAIARFIDSGGTYLGFCGGAGLALSVPDGLGLIPLSRAAGAQRLPGLSGPLWVEPAPGAESHSLWPPEAPACCWPVWWPGQFEEPHDPAIRVLARYQGPSDELYLADLALGQTDPEDLPALERDYGLPLDPAPLWGQPAVIEARLGQGRLLLSYPHLDTPGDETASQALERLWWALLGPEAQERPRTPPQRPSPALSALAGRCAGLWEVGRTLGLWRPRHPAMPLWRRGARGLEFWKLVCLSRAAAQWSGRDEPSEDLSRALEPVLAQGEAALLAQAALLAGREPEAPSLKLLTAWFPRPRRCAGDWAAAQEALEKFLFNLFRAADRP